SLTCSFLRRATHFSSRDHPGQLTHRERCTGEPRPSLIALVGIVAHFHSLLCLKCHRAYTILVNDEFVFLASHIFQAQILAICSCIEELITRIDTAGEPLLQARLEREIVLTSCSVGGFASSITLRAYNSLALRFSSSHCCRQNLRNQDQS